MGKKIGSVGADNIRIYPNCNDNSGEWFLCGWCGQAWTLDCNNVLSISGSGKIKDYDYTENLSVPWRNYCKQIKAVVIDNGVTYVGECAFYCCAALDTIFIPDSVTAIGWSAFYGCRSLSSATIADRVMSICDHVFDECNGLQTVYYGGTQEQWGTISVGKYNNPLVIAKKEYNHIHQYIQNTVVPSTCTEWGYIGHLCGYGETMRDSYLAPYGHIHADNDAGAVTQPICMEQGYTTYTCLHCGESYRTDITDALGHDEHVDSVAMYPTVTPPAPRTARRPLGRFYSFLGMGNKTTWSALPSPWLWQLRRL